MPEEQSATQGPEQAAAGPNGELVFDVAETPPGGEDPLAKFVAEFARENRVRTRILDPEGVRSLLAYITVFAVLGFLAVAIWLVASKTMALDDTLKLFAFVLPIATGMSGAALTHFFGRK